MMGFKETALKQAVTACLPNSFFLYLFRAFLCLSFVLDFLISHFLSCFFLSFDCFICFNLCHCFFRSVVLSFCPYFLPLNSHENTNKKEPFSYGNKEKLERIINAFA